MAAKRPTNAAKPSTVAEHELGEARSNNEFFLARHVNGSTKMAKEIGASFGGWINLYGEVAGIDTKNTPCALCGGKTEIGAHVEKLAKVKTLDSSKIQVLPTTDPETSICKTTMFLLPTCNGCNHKGEQRDKLGSNNEHKNGVVFFELFKGCKLVQVPESLPTDLKGKTSDVIKEAVLGKFRNGLWKVVKIVCGRVQPKGDAGQLKLRWVYTRNILGLHANQEYPYKKGKMPLAEELNLLKPEFWLEPRGLSQEQAETMVEAVMKHLDEPLIEFLPVDDAETESEGEAQVKMVGADSGGKKDPSEMSAKLRWSCNMTQEELQRRMPQLRKKLTNALRNLQIENLPQNHGLDREAFVAAQKELIDSCSGLKVATHFEGKTQDEGRSEAGEAGEAGEADPQRNESYLEDLGRKLTDLSIPKAAWAKNLSLFDNPRNFNQELSDAMKGMRMADVESSEVEDARDLLFKCSGGRALKGCIPTKDFWQLQPSQFMMALPETVQLRILSWSSDLETKVDSSEKSGQFKTLASLYGMSRAESAKESTSGGAVGISVSKSEESKSGNTTDETKQNEDTTEQSEHTSHHVRIKAIGKYLVEMPDVCDLALSDKALQRLRNLFQAWQRDVDLLDADLEVRSHMLRSFFQDFGSHLNTGPVSVGGLFVTEGTIISKEKLSGRASARMFSEATSSAQSNSSKVGFDGAALGSVAAAQNPAAGALISSIKVENSHSSSSEKKDQSGTNDSKQTQVVTEDSTTTIHRSTFGGLPTGDFDQWSESIMKESEKGGRLHIVDLNPSLVGVWDLVKRSFWDFGKLSVHCVDTKMLSTFVSTLRLVFEDSFSRYFTFHPDGCIGVSVPTKRTCQVIKDMLQLPSSASWVLIVPRVDKSGIPIDNISSMSTTQCLAWVNRDYKQIQGFAQFLKLEFKAIFGQDSSCPNCDKQCLPLEMEKHRKYCSQNASLASVFTKLEKLLFNSYELRMQHTESGTSMIGFTLTMPVKCFICGKPIQACDINDHLRICVVEMVEVLDEQPSSETTTEPTTEPGQYQPTSGQYQPTTEPGQYQPTSGQYQPTTEPGQYQPTSGQYQPTTEPGSISQPVGSISRPLSRGSISQPVGSISRPLSRGSISQPVGSISRPLSRGGISQPVGSISRPLSRGSISQPVGSISRPLSRGSISQPLGSISRPLSPRLNLS